MPIVGSSAGLAARGLGFTSGSLPGAPTSVAGTLGNGSVALTWTAPASAGSSPISDYRVEYATSATFASGGTLFADGVSSATSATVTGLTNGTTYYFRVAAITGVGTGAYSAISSAVTPATTPGAVQTLALSASDRTITATWSAPASNGGSVVTSYTVETQLNTDAWVNRGSQSSGCSFTVRNNATNQARSYKVRVTANNAVGGGTATESASATPNFPAIGTPSIGLRAGTPNSALNSTDSAFQGYRYLTVSNITPSVCSAYSYTRIVMLNTPVGGSGYTAGLNIPTGSNSFTSTANQSADVLDILNDYTSNYVSPRINQTYNCVIQTFNTDGDYIQSAFSANFSTGANLTFSTFTDTSGWSAESAYSASTGVFTITGNTFTQTSGYVLPGVNTNNNGDVQYRISNVRLYARTGSAGTTICTSSRYFLADFSGTSTTAGTAGGSKNALASPWSTNSGTTYQSQLQGWTLGYGNAGAGRLRCRGQGTIGTWQVTPSDQRIYAYFDITGFSRTWVTSGYTTTYYY